MDGDHTQYTSPLLELELGLTSITSLKVSEPLSEVVEEVLIIAEIHDFSLFQIATIQFICVIYVKAGGPRVGHGHGPPRLLHLVEAALGQRGVLGGRLGHVVWQAVPVGPLPLAEPVQV